VGKRENALGPRNRERAASAVCPKGAVTLLYMRSACGTCIPMSMSMVNSSNLDINGSRMLGKAERGWSRADLARSRGSKLDVARTAENATVCCDSRKNPTRFATFSLTLPLGLSRRSLIFFREFF
jgi:hypothetical protein